MLNQKESQNITAEQILSKQTGKTIEQIDDSEPFYLHQGEVIKSMKEIYNQALRSNVERFSLEDMKKSFMAGRKKEETDWKNVEREHQEPYSPTFSEFIQSITKEQPKNNTLMVEYEGLCIQTGMPCGFPCIGDCKDISIKRPKIENGSIVIVRN